MKYHSLFVQMEADLRMLDKSHKLMQQGERAEATLAKVYENILSDEQNAIDWMYEYVTIERKLGTGARGGKAKGKGKAVRGSKSSTSLNHPEEVKAPEVKKFMAKYWALIPFSSYGWRLSENRKRDFKIYGKLVFVAQVAVDEYRETLFEKSEAACFLRNTFQDAMRGLCTDRAIEFHDRKPIQSNSTWVYADMLEAAAVERPDPKSLVTITQLRGLQTISSSEKTRIADFVKGAKALERLPVMTATPGSHKINPAISHCFTKLILVRFTHHTLYDNTLTSVSLQAVLLNAERLKRMQQAGLDTGLNMGDINPYDKRWFVADDEIPEPTFTRIKAWPKPVW